MTDKLPPPLLALFAPRPALRYIPPQDADPEVKAQKKSAISGIASFLSHLSEYKATDDYTPTESWLQKKDRLRYEKQQKLQKLASGDISDDFDPNSDPQVRGDAFKTLFVSRLDYEVKESDLEREFGRFGPIERIRIVKNLNEKNPKKKHRGYAFIVYEREKDMKAAYKETDGIRIKDRRVLVDVERGRTVKGWKPRRLGGGLGGRGYTKATPARPGGFGGAPSGPGGFGGGFRGGFGGRGGFRGGFRGDRGGFGGRGGIGYQGGRGGFQGANAPAGAPSGPGGRSGYGGGGHMNGDSGRNGVGDRDGHRGGGGRYGDGSRNFTGSNREPVSSRDRGFGGGGGDRDRDRDRESHRDRYGDRRDDDHSRKRYHDDSGYDDPRQKRRY